MNIVGNTIFSFATCLVNPHAHVLYTPTLTTLEAAMHARVAVQGTKHDMNIVGHTIFSFATCLVNPHAHVLYTPTLTSHVAFRVSLLSQSPIFFVSGQKSPESHPSTLFTGFPEDWAGPHLKKKKAIQSASTLSLPAESSSSSLSGARGSGGGRTQCCRTSTNTSQPSAEPVSSQTLTRTRP